MELTAERTALAFGSRQDTSNKELISVARQAESWGYDTIFTGESWGRDAITILTMLACYTEKLRLGTGIITVFSRTPALIAQSIASLDIISNGRATLGLGTSGRIVIEDWHGVEFRRPLARTREYIEIIKKALSGKRVDYQGEVFQLGRFRLGASPVQENIPIYVASLGPRNLQLTGELADGWLPVWTHLRDLPTMKGMVTDSADWEGRDLTGFTVAPQILCCATDDGDELAQAEASVRGHMAYYVGGMGSYYFNLFCRYGYEDEALNIRAAWADGDRARAAALITDDMVENIAILGNADSCRAKLQAFREAGADMPVVAFPHGASQDAVLRTLEALAPVNAPAGSGQGSA